MTNDSEILQQIFREVTEISMPEDGIEFDSGSISIEETQFVPETSIIELEIM